MDEEDEDQGTTTYYRREWLNLPQFHGGAYVIAEVRRYPRDGRGGSVDGSFTVADCNRVVSLDLRAYEPADVRNALHKARMLRDCVVEMTAALDTAYGWLLAVQGDPDQPELPYEPVRT